MNELKNVQDTNKHLKELLNEAKTDCIKIISDSNQKDIQIQQLDKVVLLAKEYNNQLIVEAYVRHVIKDQKNQVLEKKTNFQYEKVNELKEQLDVGSGSSNSSALIAKS